MAEAKKQEVVSVEEELAREAKTAAALQRPTGGAISLRSGIISWQGNPVAGNRLQCVVLDSVFENRWYTRRYDSDNPSNPSCFALAREEKDLAPHEDSEMPQGSPKPSDVTNGYPEGMCLGCPQNAWGSQIRDGVKTRGKACAQIQRLVLIPISALESDKAIEDAEVAILKLPVTSVRYWSAYVNKLAATGGRTCYSVGTEIYTEMHPKHQFHVHFNMLHLVKNEMIGALRKKIKAAEPLLMAPYAASQNAEPTTADSKAKKF